MKSIPDVLFLSTTVMTHAKNNKHQRNQMYPFSSTSNLVMYILGHRLQNAIPGDILHGRGDLLDEPLVATQVVTEEVPDAKQLRRVGTSGASLGLELLDHGILDLEGIPVVVDAVKVAEPSGGDEAQATERAGHPDSLGNRGHDELRDLARGIEADTGQLVHDGRVGEALDKGAAVLVDVDARDLGEEGLRLLLHHLPDEFVVHLVLHDLVGVFEAGQRARVAHGRVAGVQQAELVLLELLDVVDVLDHLDTDLLERRAAVAELVLDHPLHEGLRDDGPGVLDSELIGEGLLVLGGGLGGDAVDHGVGEGALFGDPPGHVGITQTGKGHEHVAGGGSVLQHVVARHDGEGFEALLAAADHGGVEEAEGGARGLVVGRVEVELDVGVLALELVGVLVVVVAALGDGERHDVGIRVSHLRDEGLAVVGGQEVGVDAADDVGEAPLGGALHDGVEVVLLPQDVTHGGVERGQAHAADGVVLDAVLVHQLVDVDGEMGSMEAADADVDDSLLDVAVTGVGRDLDAAVTVGRDVG